MIKNDRHGPTDKEMRLSLSVPSAEDAPLPSVQPYRGQSSKANWASGLVPIVPVIGTKSLSDAKGHFHTHAGSKNQHFAQLVALFDRLRSLAEDGDGFTIVPRAEAFGSAIHDLAQPLPGTAAIVDPSES
jgi:hypothetical protein